MNIFGIIKLAGSIVLVVLGLAVFIYIKFIHKDPE